MMKCCSKEQISSNGRTSKPEHIIGHVCPSKLSKRELEDLYFTLVQNNIGLKQTINELSEKIKYQTTKLQRMLATQRAYMGTENRDCCATAKAIIQEQKLVIIDLKNANENLQEQINNLNVKLCSTKQFLKRTSVKEKESKVGKSKLKSTMRPDTAKKVQPDSPKKVLPDSAKNSSTSAFHTKCNEESTVDSKSVSTQHLDSDLSKKLCDQNVCRTQMEDLKQKVLNLQEELAKTHDEYSNRIALLELEVIDLHSENMRVRSEKAVYENGITVSSNEANDIRKKLVETEYLCERLAANLRIEKGKVAELETQVKAANMTSDAMKTIGDRLNNENMPKDIRRGSIISTRTIVPDSAGSTTNETKYLKANKNLQDTSNFNKTVGIDDNLKSKNYKSGRYQTKDNLEPDDSSPNKVPNDFSPGFFDSPRNKNVNRERRRESISRDGTTRRQSFSNEIQKTDFGNAADNQRENGTRRDSISSQRGPIPLDNGDTSRQPRQNVIAFQENENPDEGKSSKRPVSVIDTVDLGYTDTQRDKRQDTTNSQGQKNAENSCSCPTDKETNQKETEIKHNVASDCQETTKPIEDSQKYKDRCIFSEDQDTAGNRQDNKDRKNIASTDLDTIRENEDQVIIDNRQQNKDRRPSAASNVIKLNDYEDRDDVKSRQQNKDRRPSAASNVIKLNDEDRDDLKNRQQNKERRPSAATNEIKPNDEDQDDLKNRQQNKDRRPSAASNVIKLNDYEGRDDVKNHQENIDSKCIEKENQDLNNRQENKNRRLSATLYVKTFDENERQDNENDPQKKRDRQRSIIPGDTDKTRDNTDQGKSNNQENISCCTDTTFDNMNKLNNQNEDKTKDRQENKDRSRSITPRDKNRESVDNPLSLSYTRPEYTTEYRSQFSPILERSVKTQQRKSLKESDTFYGTDVIPEDDKKIKTSPEMSQLVNKSNDSTCFCSGPCQCAKSFKSIPSDKTAVSVYAPSTSNESKKVTPMTCASKDPKNVAPTANASTEPDKDKATPMTSEDQMLMKKFMSLFSYTPVELGESPQPIKTVTDKSERSVADASTSKTANDSGFTDISGASAPSEEEKELLKTNRELEKKLAEMQDQLEQLKSHVLSRKNTYTVFKDDTTSVNEQPENDAKKSAIPVEVKAQDTQDIKGDPKRVCLKIPRKGYVIIQQLDPEDENDQDTNNLRKFDGNASCESTCGKEGLSCTKECIMKNKKDGQKNPDVKRDIKKKEADKRYQIPGPIPADRKEEKIEPNHVFLDVPVTERLKDSKRYKPDQYDNTSTPASTSAPSHYDKNNLYNNSMPQKTNFYEGYSIGVQQNTFCIKEESPPTKYTQKMDASTNPTYREENLNARCVKESQAFPNPQHTKTWIEPNIREPMNSKAIQPIDETNFSISESMKVILQPEDYAKETKNTDLKIDQITVQRPIEETIDNCKLKHAENMNAKPVENASVKATAVRCACRAAKKVPITCVCPPLSEFTTNVLHTSTPPITLQNSKMTQKQTASKYNTENVLSSSAQHNLPRKSNFALGTENDKTVGESSLKTFMDNIERNEKESDEKDEKVDITNNTRDTGNNKNIEGRTVDDNDRTEKSVYIKDKQVDIVNKSERPSKAEQNSERLNKRQSSFKEEDQKHALTLAEQVQHFKERSMDEANKIQRDYRSDKYKSGDSTDNVRNNVTTYTDVSSENRVYNNRNTENRYNDSRVDKNIDRRQSRFKFMDRELQYAEKNINNEINNTGKPLQDNHFASRLVDTNGRGKQFNDGEEFMTIDKIKENNRFVENDPRDDVDNTNKTHRENLQPEVTPIATSSPYNKNLKAPPNRKLVTDTATDQLDICEEYAHICTCPPTSLRHTAVFRSCSSTLCFRTIKASSHVRKCDCSTADSKSTCGTQLSVGDGDRKTDSKTYTIEISAEVEKVPKNNNGTYSRGTSPENTDQEISSMTDLPSEKETLTPSQTPRCQKCARYKEYSPGQENTVTTKSNSETVPTSSSPKTAMFSLGENEPNTKSSDEYEPKSAEFSLSEGEMPQQTTTLGYEKRIQDTKPEQEKRNETNDSSKDKVEQALASISEELARCRQLLEKPKEKPASKRLKDLKEDDNRNSKEEKKDLMEKNVLCESPEPSTFALHRAKAKPHIGNGPDTPHVMFTLHIGTVVLSDEAVINSRNLSLVLTWKFYNQNVAMSHMRPGRVVHFDFSTEYDLKLTDNFLMYLKTEELQIKVCEVNKLDAPLASCSLPLREALLHTNRRADMSLALLAGPNMRRSAPAADILDTRDEMGVLDLWCMLRADARIVPLINKAIAKSRPSKVPSNGLRQQSLVNSSLSPLIMQLDDDTDEVHLSADLDQTFHNNDRLPVNDSKNDIDRGVHNQRRHVTNYGYADVSEGKTKQNTNLQDLSDYPSPRARAFSLAPDKKTKLLSTNTTDGGTQKELKRISSGYIINEVPTSIKSDEQMKQAISRTQQKSERISIVPTLQDKYDKSQAKTRSDEPRVSYGEISIPSLRRQRRYTDYTASNIADVNSCVTGHSTNSISGYWQKLDEKDPVPARERRPSLFLDPATDQRSGRFYRSKKAIENLKMVKIDQNPPKQEEKLPSVFPEVQMHEQTKNDKLDHIENQTIIITILWLALNEECAAMNDPNVQRLYVAYSFLGRSGAELETPMSLPKPKQYQDKCYFNFKKLFQLNDAEMEILGRLALCRSPRTEPPNPNECVVFTVVSEPVEDPLGLNNCEDIGTAHLYFGDLLAYSAGSDTYTEVIPIYDAQVENSICGVLCIRVDGLTVVRNCLRLTSLDTI